MRIGFLLLSTDEAPLLEHALAAALAEEPDDLVVVDNCSGDGTEERAARMGARVVRLEPRHSYCRAMNVGIAAVNGDAVALLQADTFVAPGYKQAVLRALRDPHVGSVAPKLVRTAGPRAEDRLDELDAAGMVFDRRRKNTLVGHGSPPERWGRRGEVFGADGAAAVYRRAALDELGLDDAGFEVFDEDLVRWASDADLAWRLRLLGWRSVFLPEAVVAHVRHYSPSTRGRVAADSRRMQFRNRYLMMLKNDSWEDLRPDLPAVLLYELLALGHVALRERHLRLAYRQAARIAPRAWRKRARVQAGRRSARPPFGLRLSA